MQRAETLVQGPHVPAVLEEPGGPAGGVEEGDLEDRRGWPSQRPRGPEEPSDVVQSGFVVRDHAGHPCLVLGVEKRDFEAEKAASFGDIRGNLVGEVDQVLGLRG